MKKYYIGLIALFILTLVAAGVAISQGKGEKQDKDTAAKVSKIADSLSNYVYSNNKIPESLDEANINGVPSTITYNKINKTSYKFCAYFNKASNSFDAGPLGIITGLLYKSTPNSNDSTENSQYLDGYTLSYLHKKGNNCQTVSPLLQQDPVNIQNCSTDIELSYNCAQQLNYSTN